ncbi:MAG: sodium:solute symporter family protein [Acidobacteria bacterium]|nr:sodium:solute symporter family protein [Acidobacteriota bacterium]
MAALHPADQIVLLVYLIGITLLGVWAARGVRSMGDFFMPRRFGKWMLVMHAFGTGTHSDQAVGVASKTFTNGLSGIWYQWLWLLCTPFYWLIAPMMRRFRALTMADVFVARFGRSVGVLFAVVGSVNLMVNIGVMLKGSGAVISSAFGHAVSTDTVIAAMTLMFLVYGIAGGLAAAIVTDFFQGILTVVFSFLMLPFVLSAVGGIDGIRAVLDDPQMFSLVVPREIGLFYILVIAGNGLIGIVTQPHIKGNCAAGRSEMDGRVGFTAGNFIKRVCTIAWSLTGLAAAAYLIGQSVDPDEVYGVMARDFLPAIMPGLLGVFVASLLASVMSSCDSFMIASSALVTENVYKPWRPAQSDRHYLGVGRLVAVLVVAGGVAFAFWLPGVVEGLEIFWKIPSIMGLAFWLGFFWRRMTVAGAWTTTAVAFLTWWATTLPQVVAWIAGLPVADALRLVVSSAGSAHLYLPWQMICYLTAGAAAGIAVSLVTRPTPESQLESFYALARTPVEAGEGDPPAPCTLPQGVRVQARCSLISRGGLEIPVPNRLSAVGFLISSFLVVMLIASFFAITQ